MPYHNALISSRPRDFAGCVGLAGIPPHVAERLDDDGRDNLEAYVCGSADNTLAAFRHQVKRWAAWCEEEGVDPLDPPARALRAFIRSYEQGRKPNTVKGMVANIGVLVSGIAGNGAVAQTKLIKAEMKRIRREKGVAEKQALAIRAKGDVMDIDAEALPFSIQQMIAALETVDGLSAIRAKFVLSFCGDTGRRCAEYRAGDLGDIAELPSGDGVFIIRRSKTDQDGAGLVKHVGRRTIRFFKAWQAARRAAGEALTAASPLIVSVDRWGHCGPRIGQRGFNIMLRDAVRRALLILAEQHPGLHNQIGTIVEAVSSHSFRVGMVEDLTVAGESVVAICVEGGWETPAMVIRYARNITAANGAGARLRRRLEE